VDYTKLGRSGLTVSRLCLGTMNFGRVLDEGESHKLLDAAADAGITYVDTANTYGWQEYKGRTEEIIGSWFASAPSRRDATVLATKVYQSMGQSPNDDGLSARNILRECDASLRRLHTDHIDVYQMHHVDRRVPWDEIWQAMEQLVTAGKVLYVGSSNFAGWDIAQAMETARARHFLGLVSEQSVYNLCQRTIELEVIPAAQAYGVAVLPWSPLNSGVLGGTADRPARSRSHEPRPTAYAEDHRDQLAAWHQVCAEAGQEPAEVALAWLLQRDGITAPIVGPRTQEQLDGAVRALSLHLDDDLISRLDEIFPGPGGPAPEAYAW
jgi:aryl-alcohol dehydrogenase-like predicted oxidoreductase